MTRSRTGPTRLTRSTWCSRRCPATASPARRWLTGTAGTSIRHYYEDTHQPADVQAGPTAVPVGLAAAAAGDFRSIRRFAERDHARIASWTELPGVTSHYSAYTNPDELVGDIRRFFRPLRTASRTATSRAASKEN